MKRASLIEKDALFYLVLAAGFEPATSSFGGLSPRVCPHSYLFRYLAKRCLNTNKSFKLICNYSSFITSYRWEKGGNLLKGGMNENNRQSVF